MGIDVDWRKRIASDPELMHGEPCVAGTRVSVSVVVGSIADGDSIDELLREYPQLTEADVRACLRFAAEAVNSFDFFPLAG